MSDAFTRLDAAMKRQWSNMGSEDTGFRRDSSGLDLVVDGLWHEPEAVDAGYGVEALQRTVEVQVDQLVDRFGEAVIPSAGDIVTRYPDDWVTGGEERWTVLPQGVLREGAFYVTRVQKGA